MNLTQRLSQLMLAIALASLSVSATATDSRTSNAPHLLVKHSVQMGEQNRPYWLHLPPERSQRSPMPVVLVLHGGGGADAQTMMARYDFDEIGDQAGFAVVYPQGIDGQWNDGRGESFRRDRNKPQADDVAYIDALIEDLATRLPLDRKRVYVVGASNGGMMTFRLGIELGHKLAAIAAVIANIPANIADQTPRRPLPVLIMNGTKDPLVPWEGGPVTVFGNAYGEVVSTARSVDYWLRASGLDAQPASRWLPDRDSRDGCRVQHQSYGRPDHAAPVELYTLQGGGHNVPGAHTPDRPRLLGNKCMDIDAAQVIWRFFASHTLAY